MGEDKLIKECYRRSIGLLRKNTGKYGVTAATTGKLAKSRRYHLLFARDISICALGMAASGDKMLMETAMAGLKTMADYQTAYGQIPSSVDVSAGQAHFHHLGSIDSGLWWLIAIEFMAGLGEADFKLSLLPRIKSTFQWLHCQDTNSDGLLAQGEAADWADERLSSGRVLFTNALWHWALTLYGMANEAELAADGLNTLFLPHNKSAQDSLFISRDSYHRSKELKIVRDCVDKVPYYLFYVAYRYASDRCDVFGNSLAIISGAADGDRAKQIVRYFRRKRLDRRYPIQVLTPPVKKNDFDWRPQLGQYGGQNDPYCYLNGGIWPMAGAFYAMALHKAGEKKEAQKALAGVAAANELNNWEFNEWLHGKTGEPMGIPGQSWNAGAFLLAYHCLNGDVKI